MNRNLSRGMETIFFNKILKLKVKYWNKKSLNGIKIREKTAKQRSVNLKIHEYKVIQSGVQGEKKLWKKQDLKRSVGQYQVVQCMSKWIPKGKEEVNNIFKKIMPQIFPNLVENIDLHKQKAHWTTSKINIMKTTPTCMTINC